MNYDSSWGPWFRGFITGANIVAIIAILVQR